MPIHLTTGESPQPLARHPWPLEYRSKTSTHAPQVEHFRSLFQSYFKFQSDQSLPRTLGFILCAACGSIVLLHAASVFDSFVVIEIAFMDNQAQITETSVSGLDSEKVS